MADRPRVALGGFSHETSTRATRVTGPTRYAAFTVHRDEDVRTAFEGKRIYVGGMLTAGQEVGLKLLPTYWAGAQPSGTIDAESYARLRAELLEAFAAQAPFDAIALELHGAAVAEGVPDVEADLVAALRERHGNLPIVSACDLHGNVSQGLVDLVDLLLPVRHYPHTDTWDRGHEVVSALPGLVSGELRTARHLEQLPMLLPPTGTTTLPGARFLELMESAGQHPEVLDCSIWHGFTKAEVPDAGVAVVVTTTGSPEVAREVAVDVARRVWQMRDDLLPHTLSPREAVRVGLASGTPVLVNEASDNPGGGGSGDVTHLLAAVLDAGAPACFGVLADPAAVAAATAAGKGATVDVQLGGRSAPEHGPPLQVSAEVAWLGDGRFVSRTIAPGWEIDYGRLVRLRIGAVDVLVAEKVVQVFEPEVFTRTGVSLEECRLIALKSAEHFRAGFAALYRHVLTADGPGLTSRDVAALRDLQRWRPMWPVDADADYPARGAGQ